MTSWLLSDADALHELHRDAETMRLVRHGRPESRAEVANVVGRPPPAGTATLLLEWTWDHLALRRTQRPTHARRHRGKALEPTDGNPEPTCALAPAAVH